MRERGALFVYFERNYKFFGKRRIKVLLTGQKVSAFILNGENDIDSSEYSKGSNFAIGGNTLRCGVTCPWLVTVYYASIAQIEKGLTKIRLFYAGDVKPTRANVLDNQRGVLSPAVKTFSADCR